jgi:hypothetical protein
MFKIARKMSWDRSRQRENLQKIEIVMLATVLTWTKRILKENIDFLVLLWMINIYDDGWI